MKTRLVPLLTLSLVLSVTLGLPVACAQEPLELTRTFIPEGAFYVDLYLPGLEVDEWEENTEFEPMKVAFAESSIEEYDITLSVSRSFSWKPLFALNPDWDFHRAEIHHSNLVVDFFYSEPEMLSENMDNIERIDRKLLHYGDNWYHANFYTGTHGDQNYLLVMALMFFEGDVFYVGAIYPEQYANLIDISTWFSSIEPLSAQ